MCMQLAVQVGTYTHRPHDGTPVTKFPASSTCYRHEASSTMQQHTRYRTSISRSQRLTGRRRNGCNISSRSSLASNSSQTRRSAIRQAIADGPRPPEIWPATLYDELEGTGGGDAIRSTSGRLVDSTTADRRDRRPTAAQ